MTYHKDSEGEDVQCDRCQKYPAENELAFHVGTPVEEWLDLCNDCADSFSANRTVSYRDPILGCASKMGRPCNCGLGCDQL